MPAIIRRITGLQIIQSKIERNHSKTLLVFIWFYIRGTLSKTLKALVTQVVLSKTGIFAVPFLFVEKHYKIRTIFAL